MSFIEQYLVQLNTEKRRWRRAVIILTVLSLIVALVTIWNLRMTGVTIANSATCGYEEHQHTEECVEEKVLICEQDSSEEPLQPLCEDVGTDTELPESIEEPMEFTEEAVEEPTEPAEEPVTEQEEEEKTVHVHTDDCYKIVEQCQLEEHVHQISCYSDPDADVETADIWEATLPKLTDSKGENMVLIAQSQLGYKESEKNYVLAEDGQTKCGITRYGQWYGNPYGDWANTFTGFCLMYSEFSKDLINSGAEVMLSSWDEQGLYRSVGKYKPNKGDIVFLDKNKNGTVDTTAVILALKDNTLTVIEGDVDNTVAKVEYSLSDEVVVGYGIAEVQTKLKLSAAAPAASATVIGKTATYNTSLIGQGGSFIIYTVTSDNKYYAIDGNGKAIEIQIDSSGTIYSEVSDTNTLYWSFEKTSNYDNKPAYYIQNVSSGKYLHPYRDSASDNGVIHTEKWGTAIYTSNTGVKLRGVNQTRYAQLSGTTFGIADNQNNGSTFYFGKAPSSVTLWLDGTNGNIMSYRGSDNTKHTVYSGVQFELPSEWKSPTKYSYKLAGWVNIKTGDYYKPGANITVTEDTVLYADWVATTYDIGRYNSYVANTISTNDFITTKVFDYSSLINLLSSNVSVNVSGSSHSETWSHVASGNVTYKGQPTLNFSFNDHDGSGTITNLNNLNNPNKYTGGTGVYSDIYNTTLGESLFGTDNLFDPETGKGIVGKHYLGEGDHLFQINTDPTSEHYGYYYYDAKLNAASYNQTDQRFYVYDYLARTSDSAGNNDAGKYSDFLPLNSPYANTNGQTVKTYNYDGENGEYSDTSHYEYDARYDANGSAANQIKANLWFGIRTDVQFGLSDTPGQKLANGEYGNKDLNGNEMHFQFTGDDDVWILVDGKVVLDLGGIHQAAEGDINFSTGEVRVNGKSAGTLNGILPGEHTLSILYLERGSSMSNCAIYFNLAPRFSLTLQKEDVLTQEVLNGAQFALYNDLECTDPCNLWPSYESYKNNDEPTNVFTIKDGTAYIWGLSPARSYYIKEKAPPNASGYEVSKGVIQLTLDKQGLNSHSAQILEEIDANGNKVPISHGFTLHNFRIEEENQAAYIVITNAQNWVTETTSVYVEKKWDDNENHTQDSVTVYLNVTDADGTVRRIREIALSEENDWKYSWTNLPKYVLDTETMTESDVLVKYSVSEAYVPGYSPTITVLKNGTYSEEIWAESSSFKNGETYILKTAQGYLSTVSASSNTLCFVEEETAQQSNLALWTATVSSGKVKLTNQSGQSLNYYGSGSTRYFNATTGTGNQTLSMTSYSNGIRLSYKSGTRTYYLGNLNGNNYATATTTAGSALTLYPMVKTVTTTTVELDGYGYSITNTPLSNETSLKVTKRWDNPMGDETLYEREQVTIKLFANGVDTGRTETVSLKSNWTATFHGLPYLDEEDHPIVYTVEESWDTEDWIPVYGPITTISGESPTYETTITNTYRWTGSYELPGTGGIGTLIYILCGLILVCGPLVYGFSLRRRYERRSKK